MISFLQSVIAAARAAADPQLASGRKKKGARAEEPGVSTSVFGQLVAISAAACALAAAAAWAATILLVPEPRAASEAALLVAIVVFFFTLFLFADPLRRRIRRRFRPSRGGAR